MQPSNVTFNLDKSCGANVSCTFPNCYLLSSGPICSDSSNNNNYNWRLNSERFPPIEYLGDIIGIKPSAPCENFDYSSWTSDNKTWLLDYFRHHWVPDNVSSLSLSNNNSIPPGSFVNPLDYIGSCFKGLYCLNQQCTVKVPNRSSQNCNSSNQCRFSACGNLTITNISDSLISPLNTSFNCVNNRTILSQLTLNNYRNGSVLPSDVQNVDDPNDHIVNSRSNGTAVVIVVIIILTLLISIGCCIKRLNTRIRPTESNSNGFSGRVRRNGDRGLSRENSVRTLPPYTEIAEEHSDNQGVVSAITRYFFPPGELPPPYDSVHPSESGTENIRRLSTLDYVSDVQNNSNVHNNSNSDETTLEEVRDGVTFEEHSPSESVSRRSTITRHDGSSTTPLVQLPEIREIDSQSLENDQEQTDETAKLKV